MINYFLKIPVFALIILQITSHSYGIDLSHQIKAAAQVRDKNFWQPLLQNNPSIGFGQSIKFNKAIVVDQKANTLNYAIYRPSFQQTVGKNVATAIPYIVYMSEDVEKKVSVPKGVIIKVYGAGTPLEVTPDDIFQEEKLWAAQGYLVYCLNLRGTQGFGDQFFFAQGKSHAVQSLVRDISYFTYLLKNNKSDPHRHKPLYHHLVTPNLPFYLTGASFGGYLTLVHATNDEENFYLKDYKTTISHRTLFDGYIASMPVTDVWRDIKSGTTAGTGRLPFFRDGPIGHEHEWIANAFQGKNVIDRHDDNIELSPLHHMKNLERPLLFIHGILDTNVSPKQTVDCIKEGIKHQKSNNIFLYVDKSMGHHYPDSTQTAKPQYETIFQFMEGVVLAKTSGVQLRSVDNLSTINDIALLLTRALNPDVNRPHYQFYYQAIQFLYMQKKKLDDQVWEELTNSNSDFFLKTIVWMHEKAKINWDRQDRRTYLKQMQQLKDTYQSYLPPLGIMDLFSCGEIPQTSLIDYYHSLHDGYNRYSILLSYLGDGDGKVGSNKLNEYTKQLRGEIQAIINAYRFGLIVASSTIYTRFYS